MRIQFHHKQTSNDLWSSPSIETSNSDSYCEWQSQLTDLLWEILMMLLWYLFYDLSYGWLKLYGSTSQTKCHIIWISLACCWCLMKFIYIHLIVIQTCCYYHKNWPIDLYSCSWCGVVAFTPIHSLTDWPNNKELYQSDEFQHQSSCCSSSLCLGAVYRSLIAFHSLVLCTVWEVWVATCRFKC